MILYPICNAMKWIPQNKPIYTCSLAILFFTWKLITYKKIKKRFSKQRSTYFWQVFFIFYQTNTFVEDGKKIIFKFVFVSTSSFCLWHLYDTHSIKIVVFLFSFLSYFMCSRNWKRLKDLPSPQIYYPCCAIRLDQLKRR